MTDAPVELRPWSEDWKAHWDQPMVWPRDPRQGRVDLADQIEKRKAISVDADASALVLVDVDKQAYDMYIEDVSGFDATLGQKLCRRTYEIAVPNTVKLVEFFRANDLPIIFVQWNNHRHQYPPLEPREGETVVHKWATGAFGSSSLDSVLRRTERYENVSTLFFAGADTAFCLESTVRAAVDLRYRSIIVEDACMSVWRRLHECTLMTMGWHLAFVTATQQVIEHYPWNSLPGRGHPLAWAR